MWTHGDRIYERLVKLCQVPSVSGTFQERLMADSIVHMLMTIPWFQNHPEAVQSHPVPDDPLSRPVVTALYQSHPQVRDTVVLLSHYDVVSTPDYRQFGLDPFDPEAYTERLRTEYATRLSEDVRRDAESGHWLFGRGVMDMKAGLAIQMDVLQELAESEWHANLLIVTTPDEETASAGMLHAVTVLNELRAQHDLEYRLCICSEPNFSAFPGDDGPYIYSGSVGKVLPLVAAVGVETHVGEPLLGVNAGWMIGDLSSRLELSTDFIDRMFDESVPAPTCLDMHVLRESYSVQTPSFAYALFNVLTLQKSPEDILEQVRNVAEQSSQAIYAKMLDTASAQQDAEVRPELHPKVYTYAELHRLGVERYGERFEQGVNDVLQSAIDASADPRETTVSLARYVSGYFTADAPFYLVMFAPPYYPHVYLDADHPEEARLLAVANQVQQDAEDAGVEVRTKRFFPGLSDVSYCRVRGADVILPTLTDHMPVLHRLYHVPIEEMEALNLPTLNIGPYGKDAHQWTERLEIPFSTTVAPELVTRAIRYTIDGLPEA